MPQLSLSQLDGVPTSLTVNLGTDPLRPERGTRISVTLYNRHRDLISQSSAEVSGFGADCLGEIAQAIVEAYLYGDSWQAAHKALSHGAADAALHDAKVRRSTL